MTVAAASFGSRRNAAPKLYLQHLQGGDSWHSD